MQTMSGNVIPVDKGHHAAGLGLLLVPQVIAGVRGRLCTTSGLGVQTMVKERGVPSNWPIK
jgi:hypothetical protein